MRARRRVTVVAPSVVAPDAPTLTAPADNADVYDGVPVAWSASVTAGQVPDRIDLVLDPGVSEVVVATDSTSTYGGNWTPTGVTPGAHTLVARFVYGSGSVDSTAANIVLFDPTVITGLVAWYDPAAAYITKDGSDKVSAWTKRAGSGTSAWNLAQATGGLQPTWQATGSENSGPAILFVAASGTKLATNGTTVTQPSTQVAKAKNTGDKSVFRTLLDGNAADARMLRIKSTDGFLQVYAGTGPVSGTIDVADSAWHNFAGVYAGASGAARTDAETVTGNVGAGSAGGLTVGEYPSGGRPWSGPVTHIALYSVAVADADLTRLFAWLDAVG